MTKYLISFPGPAMEVPQTDWAAVEWATRLAKACRCSQELREFQYDPES